MRRALLLVAVLAARARGDSWTVTGEAGGELDTNVQRVETGPGLTTTPVSSPVARFGVRADGRGDAAGGTYVLGLSDLTRVVSDDTVQVENVTLLAGDLRWMHAIGERPVALGFALIGADALPISDPIGARTFSNAGGDVLLSARDGDTKRLLVAVGARDFVYKPDHTFDWVGPTASARLDLVLWQPSGGTRSLELAIAAGFEARAYDSYALVDTCPPGSPPDPSCSAATTQKRSDRFERAGAELTYFGKPTATVGYQLIVIDSNSYGQSLARHRATASVTVGLPGDVYATALGILQIDRYLDGLVIASDQLMRDFANIEDESSSSLQLRLAKKLSSSWSLEARAAVWKNLGSSTMDLSYERELVYGGVVFSK